MKLRYLGIGLCILALIFIVFLSNPSITGLAVTGEATRMFTVGVIGLVVLILITLVGLWLFKNLTSF